MFLAKYIQSKEITVANQETLGIIAGGGQFPRLIAKEARKQGHAIAICGFRGNTDPDLVQDCDAFEIVALGQLSKLIDFFKKNNVKRICMAGTINKPRALDIRPDFRAAKLLFTMKTKGDDVLLRAVLGELEREGFSPTSAAELVPSLRCPEGILTSKKVPQEVWDDINFGWPIVKSIGRLDIGQCIVVRKGIVMAVECLEGTDATIQRGAELGGADCVTIKLAKPEQDERVDLPSIGMSTLENLVHHKYTALAIEAYKTLFFDRENTIKFAQKHNIHIIALPNSYNPTSQIDEEHHEKA